MKNENLSLRIKRLPHSRMLKSEMADYAEKTISIYEAHDSESEMVNPMFDLLRAKTEDISLLRLSYGIDTERLRENKLKADMMLQISAFKLKVRMLTRSNLELDLHVVQNVINSHLRKLNKCKNDKQLSQKVAGFSDLIKTDVALQAAITEFELSTEAQNIIEAHTNLTEASQKRVKLLSKRPEIYTKGIMKDMSVAIDNLFKAIEVSHLVNTVAVGEEDEEQIDFAPLIDELNQLSEMYYKSISIRYANNKRKAEEDKDRNPRTASVYSFSDDDEYTPIYGEDTAMEIIDNEDDEPADDKASENEFGKVLDESLEEKKAAASSAKHVQLPNLKNEADL